MEKKIKALLWTIVGIVTAITVSSVLLAFLAPSYLIILWAGLIGGCTLGLAWKRRKELVKLVENVVNFDAAIPEVAVVEETAKDEKEEKEVKVVEKPAKKTRRSSKKK